MNETSKLRINQTGGPSGVVVYVVNDWCAVNKTPVPHEKVSQVASFNGTPVGMNMSFPLALNVSADLDVETVWKLVKCVNYTKAINWLGISKGPFMPPILVHECVLFELILPVQGVYTFTLVASAEVALVGDVNSQNDKATGPPLTLTVSVP